MERLFFEVFPTLKTGAELKKNFEGMTVVKVILSSDRRTLKVFLKGSRYIRRSLVHQIERDIASPVLKPTARSRYSSLSPSP